ncbi:ubiquitin carboxyl-terminal hydrolase isozyme L3 [Antennarius striatus]|uniref:ubiquitin carboxyl-terminal hydrolase isozyme L3 n=1 Tax=Antennarius striatus TaxID=241820 RepID=UPI0035B33C56
MAQFVSNLGMKLSWRFEDVFGLDPDLLSLVSKPVCAVLLLFPITEKYETFKREEEERLKTEGQEISPNVYFMKQTIGNACGTVGIIHAIANNMAHLEFESGATLKKFIEETSVMTPEKKAAWLEVDERIRDIHESSAQEGQTEAPSVDDKVNLHFIAFVNVEGLLYELDGRKLFPIVHGKTSEDTFLEDAAEVCKTFMNRDPEEVNFNIIALSKYSN